jgi:CRISPR type III-B/RAMP module RAMP protein Cmr1
MDTVNIGLKSVTPLFIGAADPNEPELRAPPFRGMFRYWFRAAAAAVIGDKSQASLKLLEASVFGDTETGSPVTVRISGSGRLMIENAQILPHHNQGNRNAIAAGQGMTLTISSPRPISDAAWQAAVSTIPLAIVFGGVGLRSRRCYGTLKITDVPEDSSLQTTPDSLEGWQTYIDQVTSKAVQTIEALVKEINAAGGSRIPTPGLQTGPLNYPGASKQSIICISDVVFPTAMDAMIGFMQRVHKADFFGGITPRQASPLWARSIQTGEGEFRLLFSTLASRFDGSDYKEINQFLTERFPGCAIQVKGWNQ